MTTLLDPSQRSGRIRISSATLTYNSQVQPASYSFDTPLKLPVGATVVGGTISTSVTSGSTTIALGIAGSTAKYKAAAAVTATATAELAIPHAAFLAAGLTAEEEILVTTAGATAPASGTLIVAIRYVTD